MKSSSNRFKSACEKLGVTSARRVAFIAVATVFCLGLARTASAQVVFTGDLLFNQGHPIVWDGPIANWIAACDHIAALDLFVGIEDILRFVVAVDMCGREVHRHVVL